MFQIRYPYFNKDRILKKEMLQELRDFPRDMLEVYTENLTDGIVSGLSPIVNKEIITFSKGIVKHNGNVFMINNPTPLSYQETETEVMIKLNFHEQTQDKDYLTYYVSIEIDHDTNLTDSQLELGRFKLKKGAYLRSNYQDLADFTTEYNTINIVDVLYSGINETTINYLILKFFAKEALNTRTQNPIDVTFCMLCLNSTRVERELIRQYIAYRLTPEQKDFSNRAIHQSLTLILDKIKRENKRTDARRNTGNKIIVD